MLKITLIIVLVNFTIGQNRNGMENQQRSTNWRASAGPVQLLKVLDILKQKVDTETRKMTTINKAEKNCWLLEKMSHRTGRNFLKHCIKQALGNRKTKLTKKENGLLQINVSMKKSNKERMKETNYRKSGQTNKKKQLKSNKENARKHLQELEKMYKAIIAQEKYNEGLARMT